MNQPTTAQSNSNNISPPKNPIEALVLKLSQPQLIEKDGTLRAAATAQLIYIPADGSQPTQSQQFQFKAPIGEIELQEIRWYIESYHRWPTGVFKIRAGKTEKALPEWGQQLYSAMITDDSAKLAFNAWLAQTGSRRFCVEVDTAPPKVAEKPNHEAASRLQALPWEILHDGTNYLSAAGNNIQVRRSLPNQKQVATLQAKLPIRVLLLSPRPTITDDGQSVGYLDHRSSALPLIQAMENLGEAMVKVDILPAPTFPALKAALQQAKDDNAAYEIVHFDGHGTYDPDEDMGALCFEKPDTIRQDEQQVMQLIYADDLAEALREYNVPLVYLDACKTAQAKDDPRASVAAKLLEEGVGSVVAMSHSVLVETARRFLEPFYKALAGGQRVGDAMLAGHSALYDDANRFKVIGAGNLELQDWFVPVLYQQVEDPQLFDVKTDEQPQESRHFSLGKLPEPPEHTFVGRSYTLLQLERLLQRQSYAVIQAGGGMGKTAIAIELTRWLVRSGRFDRAVFISVESQNVQDVKGVIDSIGRQLLPKYTVAQYDDDIKAALHPIEQALKDQPTLMLFDNMESVLPDHKGVIPAGVADVTDLLELCQSLLEVTPATKLIFTTREALPAPFSNVKNQVQLRRLFQDEAIELVEKVMTKYDKLPPENGDAKTPEQIAELVEVVNCHPRALVLLAREIDKGVKATTENIRKLMAKLEEQNPGDRENSLYASVELSLRQLPQKHREQVDKLAVFYGGCGLIPLTAVFDGSQKMAETIAGILVKSGMASLLNYCYLQFDPALSDYLKLNQTKNTSTKLRNVWAQSMLNQVNHLYEQWTKNSTLALNLVLLDLNNIMALLDWLQLTIESDQSKDESVTVVAATIEQLLAKLGRPQAMARARVVRELAAITVPTKSEAFFHNKMLEIDRLTEIGQYQLAIENSSELIKWSQASNYPGVDYDCALARHVAGSALFKGGHITSALRQFIEAQQLFEALGQKGFKMATAALTMRAGCLVKLGQLDSAEKKYQENIDRIEALKDFRGSAICRLQMADVLRRQHRYDEAIINYENALASFKNLNEPPSIATTLTQLGMVYRDAGRYDEAEAAYSKSLEIYTQNSDRIGQGYSLNQLGGLYGSQLGRTKEALAFYSQAADIAFEIKDYFNESIRRNNMAYSLLNLKQYGKARHAIIRVLECKRQYGFESEPWISYDILRQIESGQGNQDACYQAWKKARDTYLEYRMQGGYPPFQPGEIAEQLFSGLAQGAAVQVIEYLNQNIQNHQSPSWLKEFAKGMLYVVEGGRTSTIADNPSLSYSSSAEILFMINRLDK